MDKKSVVFFMVYHKRPELTRMSLWHMAKVAKKFRDAGHEVDTIVIGSEPEQRDYCEKLGIEHLWFKNDPLFEKMKFAWMSAKEKNRDYICWMGSNNVHSDEFWEKSMKKINGHAVASFGTKNFTIVDSNPKNQKTMKWTRRRYHTCSCGQFFFTRTIKKTINFQEVFSRPKNSQEGNDFDGSINNQLVQRWGPSIIEAHEDSDGLDCIDIKSDTDIHSFDRYTKGRYPQDFTRDEIYSKFEELQMLESGEFRYA
jgi:hypothetical protein